MLNKVYSKDLKNWKNVKNQVHLIGNQVFCRIFWRGFCIYYLFRYWHSIPK